MAHRASRRDFLKGKAALYAVGDLIERALPRCRPSRRPHPPRRFVSAAPQPPGDGLRVSVAFQRRPVPAGHRGGDGGPGPGRGTRGANVGLPGLERDQPAEPRGRRGPRAGRAAAVRDPPVGPADLRRDGRGLRYHLDGRSGGPGDSPAARAACRRPSSWPKPGDTSADSSSSSIPKPARSACSNRAWN